MATALIRRSPNTPYVVLRRSVIVFCYTGRVIFFLPGVVITVTRLRSLYAKSEITIGRVHSSTLLGIVFGKPRDKWGTSWEYFLNSSATIEIRNYALLVSPEWKSHNFPWRERLRINERIRIYLVRRKIIRRRTLKRYVFSDRGGYVFFIRAAFDDDRGWWGGAWETMF